MGTTAAGQLYAFASTVDFGSGAQLVTTTVSGAFGWVRSASEIDAVIEDSVRAEEAMIEGLILTITNIVPGVSFDVIAFVPDGMAYGAFGIYIRGGSPSY